MVERVIDTDMELELWVRFLRQHKRPFTATATAGRKRSNHQNRLQRQWLAEIAEQFGDRTPEEVRAYCKLTIGVPILRAENERFRQQYDRAVRPLPYWQKLSLMSEPLDMPITRLMTTKQAAAYLDAIHRHFSSMGIVLTAPPDKRFGEPQAA